MTLAANVPINSYVGTGNVNTYPFTFPVYLSSQIQVSVFSNAIPPIGYNLLLGIDYVVNGLSPNGDPALPGSITLVSSGQPWILGGNLVNGWVITIQSNVPYAQTTSIRNQGDFYRSALENELDYLMMCIQQLNMQIAQLIGGTYIAVLPSIMQIQIVNSVGPINIASGNTYICHTSVGVIQLVLPLPSKNAWFIVKDADQMANTNNIQILRNGPSLIDGIAQTLILPASNGAWMIASDGNNWFSLAMNADLVLNDVSNGHTYRLLMQNGQLSQDQIT